MLVAMKVSLAAQICSGRKGEGGEEDKEKKEEKEQKK